MAFAVRRARSSDVPHLLPKLERFAQFFGGKHSLFPSMETAEAIITGLITTHPFWVAESGEKVVGFIGGVLLPHNFNPDVTVLQELFWWVDEEHRGTRAGKLLLNAYVEYGRANAHMVVMTLEHDSPVNPASLERMGFRVKEHNYMLEC